MRFFRLALLAAVVFPVWSRAQIQDGHARRVPALSERIESATGGTMRLVRARNDRAQIIAANGKGCALLNAAASNDKNAVSAAVRLWLGRYSEELLGIGADAELREYETRRIGNLWQTSFRIYYNNIPIRERYVKVNTGALTGAVMMVRSTISAAKPNAAAPAISYETIHETARGEIAGNEKEISRGNLVYVDNGRALQLAFEVIAGSANRERWRLSYDAQTGKLIEKKDMLLQRCFEHDGFGEVADIPKCQFVASQPLQLPQGTAGGRITAIVHPGSPTDTPVEVGLPSLDITVNGTTTMTDSLGYWSLPSVTHPLLITTGLKNSYLDVKKSGELVRELTNTISIGNGNITWDNTNSTESERDALYSLLRARAYIKSRQPDLQNIDQFLRATVDFDATCNAYYDPSEPGFTFFAAGAGCAAMAQVADVVYHEFGHRVNNCYYANTDAADLQDGSLGEGFADIYSAFVRDDPRIGVGFFDNPARVLRNIENNRMWPKDIDVEIHINGLIVGGAYWDLRKATGLETARTLFHAMLALTPDGNGVGDEVSLGEAFANVLVATILGDDDDNDLANGTPHLQDIVESFAKHNITLGNLLALDITPIEDQDAATASYPVSVSASYSAPVGALDESSVTLHYSIDGATYTPLVLSKSSGALYAGAIPKMSAGTIVSYYASGKTTLGDMNESPSPDAPLQFLVGFRQEYFDNFETDKNWTTRDSAASGKWERGEPQGTWFPGADGFFVQQDTDRSASGTFCYITGNMNTSTPSVDDVDNGETILTSPKLDFSNMRDPYIRFWNYYSNNLGQNPGSATWLAEISADGKNWMEVISTQQATDGWQPALFRVKDYITPSSGVQMRFIASDTIGSLVEAALDDFEVLDPVANSAVNDDVIEQGIGVQVYPQPASHNHLRYHITGNTPSSIALSLRSIPGVEWLTLSNAADEGELLLPDYLPNGMYILEVTAGENKISRKIVIAR